MRSLHILGIGLLCTALVSACGGGATKTVISDTAANNSIADANTTPNDSAVSVSAEAIQQEMLDVHARTRAAVAVMPLIWSGKMENYAQEWANYLANQNNCQMEHRSNLNQNPLKAGENLFWGGPRRWSDGRTEVQPLTATQVAQSWASEKAFYNYSSHSCATGKKCGHYTQMVWRDTIEVGCAMAVCPDKGQIWVCNYNPPGNYIGQLPY